LEFGKLTGRSSEVLREAAFRDDWLLIGVEIPSTAAGWEVLFTGRTMSLTG
jgi:hypothetical protein